MKQTLDIETCINPELRSRLHEYELGRLADAERESFEEHLMSCPFCLQEVRAMRPVAALVTEQRDALVDALRKDGLTYESLRNRLLSRPETMWDKLTAWLATWQGRTSLAGAVAVFALLMLVLRGPAGPSPFINDLSFEVPPYKNGITLRGEGQDEARSLFESAMRFYNRGDYVTAAQGIKQSLVLDQNHPDRWLYLGMTRFAQHDAKGAIKSLRRAERDGQGLVKMRARWYLAQSYLLAGNVRAAEPLLHSVAAEDGEYMDDARVLLDRIAEHGR